MPTARLPRLPPLLRMFTAVVVLIVALLMQAVTHDTGAFVAFVGSAILVTVVRDVVLSARSPAA